MNRRAMTLRGMTLVGVACLALLPTACSSDDEGGDSSAGTTAESSATTDAPADSAVATDGEPADTSATAPEATSDATSPDTAATAVSGVVAQPEIFDAVDAAVEAINGAGGIPDPAGGPNRPLEVVRCEAGAGGNVEADVALRCAQDS